MHQRSVVPRLLRRCRCFSVGVYGNAAGCQGLQEKLGIGIALRSEFYPGRARNRLPGGESCGA